jgi:hypothetical protein
VRETVCDLVDEVFEILNGFVVVFTGLLDAVEHPPRVLVNTRHDRIVELCLFSWEEKVEMWLELKILIRIVTGQDI